MALSLFQITVPTSKLAYCKCNHHTSYTLTVDIISLVAVNYEDLMKFHKKVRPCLDLHQVIGGECQEKSASSVVLGCEL